MNVNSLYKKDGEASVLEERIGIGYIKKYRDRIKAPDCSEALLFIYYI